MVKMSGSFQRRREEKPLINERIRHEKMQLINAQGINEGVVSKKYALEVARESGLDLVIIAESGKDGVPVAKIIDHGKMLYAKKKQQAGAKKKQQVIQVKELKFRAKIGDHDFNTKLKRAVEFLNSGKRVKFTLMFRGREITMKGTYAKEMLEKIKNYLEEHFDPTNLIKEKDMRTYNMWSTVYYLKKLP